LPRRTERNDNIRKRKAKNKDLGWGRASRWTLYIWQVFAKLKKRPNAVEAFRGSTKLHQKAIGGYPSERKGGKVCRMNPKSKKKALSRKRAKVPLE